MSWDIDLVKLDFFLNLYQPDPEYHEAALLLKLSNCAEHTLYQCQLSHVDDREQFPAVFNPQLSSCLCQLPY